MCKRFVMTKRLLLVVVIFATTASCLWAADFTAVSGKTNWTQRVSFHCDETPLPTLLARLADTYHFTFFLDRRVDPGTLVACRQSERPLIDALAETIESCDLSWCVLQSHIYIGPKDAAGQLLLACALVHQKIAKAGGKYASLVRQSTLQGKQFCQPRELLEHLAQSARMSWNGLDRMPLDSWNAFFVSPLPVADQMQMLLIGFGVRFDVDMETATIKPIPLDDGLDVTRMHAAKSISSVMQTSFSHCRFDPMGAMVRVTGPYAELARLEWELAQTRIKNLSTSATQAVSSASGRTSGRAQSARGSSRRKGAKEVTGTIENQTLEALFATLGPEFDVKFKLGESLTARGITLKTRISCKFDRAGLKSVLDLVAAELNARHERQGDEIVFSDKDK